MIYICAIIKNEHRYLKEWIDYHFNLGIDRIMLYEDGGESHYSIISNYDPNIITLERIESTNPNNHSNLQLSCYRNFYNNIMQIDDMCFFIDIDEYIVFQNNNYNLDLLIKDIIKEDTIDLPIFWKVFNANGHIKRPTNNISTIDTYTQESPYNHWKNNINRYRHDSKIFAYKKKNDRIVFSSSHHILGRSEKEYERLFYRYKDKIRLNHYYTRSYEDWCEKKERGGFFESKLKSSDDMFFKHNPDLIRLKKED